MTTYKEFKDYLSSVNNTNYWILKEGYNECDMCLDFHLDIRELIGRMKERLSDYDKKSDDHVVMIHYYVTHKAFIFALAEKEKRVCSHMSKIMDLHGFRESDAFINAIKKLEDA